MASTVAYINVNDIKASIAFGFDLQNYVDEANDYIEDLAEELGVRNPLDIKTPIPYRLKRYAVVYALTRLCQDKIGVNNIEAAETEKYAVLYGMYRKELSEVKQEISYEMITGNVDSLRDRAINTGVIFRT